MGLAEGVTEVADSDEEPFTSSPVELIKTNSRTQPSQSNYLAQVSNLDEDATSSRGAQAQSQGISNDTVGDTKDSDVDAADVSIHKNRSDVANFANFQPHHEPLSNDAVALQKERESPLSDPGTSSLEAGSRHQAHAESSDKQNSIQSSTSRDPTNDLGATIEEAPAEVLPNLVSDTIMTEESSRNLQPLGETSGTTMEEPQHHAQPDDPEQPTSSTLQDDVEGPSTQPSMQQDAPADCHEHTDSKTTQQSLDLLGGSTLSPSTAPEEADCASKDVQGSQEANAEERPPSQSMAEVGRTKTDDDGGREALHSISEAEPGQAVGTSQEFVAPTTASLLPRKPGEQASRQDVPMPDQHQEAEAVTEANPTTAIPASNHAQLAESTPESSSPTKPASPTKSLSPPKTTQETTLAELKAQRTALLASLAALPNIQSLIAESDTTTTSQSPESEPTNEEVMAAANKLVKHHIKLLHEYNEIKDTGQGLMGLIADQRGVRIVEVQDEFGIESQD
jgi:hypothetical protein